MINVLKALALAGAVEAFVVSLLQYRKTQQWKRAEWVAQQMHEDNLVKAGTPLLEIYQSFGDFLGFNPHCHILVTDGCFYGDKGMFRVAPPLELKRLEAIFRHKVFRRLPNKGKITKEMIAMLSTWRHCRLATSSAATAYRPTMMRLWNIFRVLSFGRPSLRNGCSTWIKRGRSCRDPRMARQPRASRRWNGWPRCILIVGVLSWIFREVPISHCCL